MWLLLEFEAGIQTTQSGP